MTSDEILQERERIKQLLTDMFNEAFEARQKLKRYRSHHTLAISGTKRVLENVFYYIDNPDYQRVEDNG